MNREKAFPCATEHKRSFRPHILRIVYTGIPFFRGLARDGGFHPCPGVLRRVDAPGDALPYVPYRTYGIGLKRNNRNGDLRPTVEDKAA